MNTITKIIQQTILDIDVELNKDRVIHDNAGITGEHFIEKDGVRHYTDMSSYVVSYTPKKWKNIIVYIGNITGIWAHLKTYDITPGFESLENP